MDSAQSHYEEAKKLTARALGLDEEGKAMSALAAYNSALLELKAGQAYLPADNRPLGEKMARMKRQVKERMLALLQKEQSSRDSPAVHSTGPPPYRTTSSSVCQASTAPPPYRTTSSTVSSAKDYSSQAKAVLLLSIDTGVRVVKVDSRGVVSAVSRVDSVNVFKYCSQVEGQPPAFLQCGVLVYPLLPSCSHVLKASPCSYVLPDLSGGDGDCVCLIIESLPQKIGEELDCLLSEFGCLQHMTQQETSSSSPSSWGSRLAGGIDKGIVWISCKISQGTEAAGNFISHRGDQLRENVKPNDTPVEIPVLAQKGIHVTKKITASVVGVSDFLMTSLARLVVKVSKKAVDAASETELVVKGKAAHPQLSETWKVTKATAKGTARIFSDLEKGAVVIIKMTKTESAKTVGHKYGPDAGKVTDDSLSIAGDVANVTFTYWSWKHWGIRFMGKVCQVLSKEEEAKLTESKQQL